MKIIDLYILIANGKEVPKKVMYDGWIFEKIDSNRQGIQYVTYDTEDKDFRYLIFCVNDLNDEVEIIEEYKPFEENKIKKLESYYDVGLEENCLYEEGLKINNVILGEPNSFGLIIDKINEIIDKLNKDKK